MTKSIYKSYVVILFLIGLIGCDSIQDSSISYETRVDDFGIQMIFVPEGKFLMGIDEDQVAVNGENAAPPHIVMLGDFYIDRFEATNAEYQACADTGASSPLAREEKAVNDIYISMDVFDTSPVMYLSWNDAKTYCEWRGARLPTEAEWEKAARGTDGRTYPWGEETDCSYANYGLRSENGVVCFEGHILSIGNYPKGVSPYGAYDMAGNVSEWVQDCYIEDFYSQLGDSIENPIGIGDEKCSRLQRGGSAGNSPINIKTYRREPVTSDYTDYWSGVRCASSP